jgi:16S rRNA (cytosine967-C5)-methyltransferase
MAWPSARQIALAALRSWRTERRFADSILWRLLPVGQRPASNRAFALELFYGVLRNLTLLDFWIGCLRASRIGVDLRDVLRLGLYQLLFLKTPPHAAVYETVELAPKRQRPVINGILRAAVRCQEELLTRAGAQPLFVRKSHPQFLVARWQQHFGAKATEELCSWNNEPPPVYGRINRLKIDPDKFLRAYPESRPLARKRDFVEFHRFPTNALNLGHCYIQDPSTVIACQVLHPQPGEKILDACAAPGGKTACIAELMKNDGVIVACDRDPERIQILQHNIARLGIGIVHAFRLDWTSGRIPKKIASIAPFDRILIDAPCSNTGVMRRRVDVRWRLRAQDLIQMPEEQFKIARSAISLLKPGGLLVYSTCSLEGEENGQLVERLLDDFSRLRFEREESCLPFRDYFDGAFAARLINTREVER